MKSIAALLACLWFSTPAISNPNETLRFSYPDSNLHAAPILEVLTAAYNTIGYQVEGVPIVGKRALTLSNSGQLDGEIFRVYSAAKSYKNLRRIPTPLCVLETYAYATTPIPYVNSWLDLKNKTVGHLIGIVLYEKRTESMRRKLPYHHEQLVTMLARGAIDIAIMEKYNFINRTAIPFHQSPNPLESDKVYHYLHKKHAKLIPLIDAQISSMVKDGTIQATLAAHLDPASSTYALQE